MHHGAYTMCMCWQDMLLIGEHELGGLPGITWEEGRTQFGMWSLLAARASCM